ncbi:MAG: hypothetical protein H0U84_08125 [Thermoleophilaceae bacterium]|nr:hypothetical protein [Thermoleophilaceae bacterium]
MAQTDVKSDSTGSQAKEQAQQVAGQAQEKAQQGAVQAKERVREQVDQRSTTAGEQVVGAAGDARSVAEELRKQGKDTPARYAEQAADRAERLGSYLRDSNGDRILRDVEDFGRRNPWGVVAGGLAVGFFASRFLKASSSERYSASTGSQAPRPTPQPAINPPAPMSSGDTGRHP